MPRIVDYSIVLDRLASQGLVCNYPNGGSFGFRTPSPPHVRGWIPVDDPTIKSAFRPHLRILQNLPEHVLAAWSKILPEPAWIMPASHWAFEFQHGSRDWLPGALTEIGVHPPDLATLTAAAALEFSLGETAPFRLFLQHLLDHLIDSDFVIAFPSHRTVCTIHHHKQLWWVTDDGSVAGGLDRVLPTS